METCKLCLIIQYKSHFSSSHKLPLGVTRKFLTISMLLYLSHYPVKDWKLDLGYFFLGEFFLRIFRLIYLACQTVTQSSCLRSGWQGPSNGFWVSLQLEVSSTSQESHSSNFLQLQEYKALAIPLTSHVFGLVFTPLGTYNTCLLVFHVRSL